MSTFANLSLFQSPRRIRSLQPLIKSVARSSRGTFRAPRECKLRGISYSMCCTISTSFLPRGANCFISQNATRGTKKEERKKNEDAGLFARLCPISIVRLGGHCRRPILGPVSTHFKQVQRILGPS